jgi:hypothetical protein
VQGVGESKQLSIKFGARRRESGSPVVCPQWMRDGLPSVLLRAKKLKSETLSEGRERLKCHMLCYCPPDVSVKQCGDRLLRPKKQCR